MFQNNQRSVLYLLHGFPSTAHLLNLPAFHAIMPSSLREGGAEQMRNTTLCYLERGDEVLMLHRVKKAADENAGKWIGVGGGFEEGESPEECLLREVYEETGLRLLKWRFRGIVTFVSDEWGTEYMHLFTSDSFSGELRECSEGVLAWKRRDEILSLPLWEGDKVFLRLLVEEHPFFSLKLRYRGDMLVEAVLDGKPLSI